MEGVSIVAMVYQYALVFRSVHGETVMVHHFILGANVGNAIQIVPHWVRIVSKVALSLVVMTPALQWSSQPCECYVEALSY